MPNSPILCPSQFVTVKSQNNNQHLFKFEINSDSCKLSAAIMAHHPLNVLNALAELCRRRNARFTNPIPF